MKLLDVHAHLEFDGLKENLDTVLANAKKAGMVLIINSGVNPESNRNILEQSKIDKIIKPSFGIYPIDAIIKDFPNLQDDGSHRKIRPFNVDEELSWIEAHKDDCIAIGEVGLDYKMIDPDKTAKPIDLQNMKNAQINNFKKIITTAKKINKPLIIHSRKAELETIEILEKNNFDKINMHCFSGKKSLIKRGIENGYFFSVPPVITRLDHFKMLVELVPLTQLLTETDAPFLSPEAGKTNEPANVTYTIKEIAKIKDLTEEEVAEQIYKNAKKLFNL